MTEKTDIAALRKAAEFLEGDEWHAEGNSVYGGAYDSGDCVCYDHIASCESINGESLNAEFIALANPAAILTLLDQLEAERQRAESMQSERDEFRRRLKLERSILEDADKKLAELRGGQEPIGVIKKDNDAVYSYAHFYKALPVGTKLFTRQPKPVVVLSDCDIGAVSHIAHWYTEEQCEAWVAGVEHAKKQMLAAGIVVKDGE